MNKRTRNTFTNLVTGAVVILLILSFTLGSSATLDYMKNKQHTEKAGCEYVEQAPCKIIYIKDDK
jgi:hypothetical protein